jgi:hypothetical protein
MSGLGIPVTSLDPSNELSFPCYGAALVDAGFDGSSPWGDWACAAEGGSPRMWVDTHSRTTGA